MLRLLGEWFKLCTATNETSGTFGWIGPSANNALVVDLPTALGTAVHGVVNNRGGNPAATDTGKDATDSRDKLDQYNEEQYSKDLHPFSAANMSATKEPNQQRTGQ